MIVYDAREVHVLILIHQGERRRLRRGCENVFRLVSVRCRRLLVLKRSGALVKAHQIIGPSLAAAATQCHELLRIQEIRAVKRARGLYDQQ